MFKKMIVFFSIMLLGACTYVNPEKQEESISNSEETTEIQFDQERPTDEELIRYNNYENPYEYYEQRETDKSLGNTDNSKRIRSEKFREQNDLNRNIYYELRNMREFIEVGVSVQDQQIYVAVHLANRVTEDEAIAKVKEVVENITGRTDVTVYVNQEYHNRIEDRKKD
ncbi:YhcN/YlaJ family sporulation lipoprotein [Filobacillus milosensis]|nr:YhcN/YlaJ family sporulation lipoprotein [Filobacillus milosensis]